MLKGGRRGRAWQREAELHKLEETFFVTSFKQRLAFLAKAAIRRALAAERQLRQQAKEE